MILNTLITGSSGFVGKNLIESLKENGISTIAFDRQQLAENPVHLPDGMDSIVHLAGKAHDLKKVSNPDEYYEVNFRLTKNLYDAFLKSKVKKFIFISSVKAAADTVNGLLTEETTPDPQTHYGKSKLMAEAYISAQPLPEGKSFYILRPCMIHGPGNKGNLNLLYTLVKKGIPYPLAAFENKRSFLSVANLSFIIKELLVQNGIASGIYNVADDIPQSTNDVITTLAYSLGVKPKLYAVSKPVIRLLAKLGDKIKLPINTEKLNKLTENYVVSNEKIKTALAVKLPLQSKDGLLITANSFK